MTEPLLAVDAALQVEDLEAQTDEDDRRWGEFAFEQLIDVLAVQHTTNPHTPLLTDSYLVVHDGTMTWDIPGSEQVAGIHVQRDLGAGTFRLEYQRAPIVALAQNWLVSRGADLDQVTLHGEQLPTTDQPSRDLEQRLALAGDRYWIANSYTSDLVLDPGRDAGGPPSSAEDLVYGFNTWMIAKDRHPEPGQHPVRVFFEDVDYLGHSYTLREGGFPDLAAAYEWTRRAGEPDNPLPPVEVTSRARSAAARATSPSAAAASTSANVVAAPPSTPDTTATRPRTSLRPRLPGTPISTELQRARRRPRTNEPRTAQKSVRLTPAALMAIRERAAHERLTTSGFIANAAFAAALADGPVGRPDTDPRRPLAEPLRV